MFITSLLSHHFGSFVLRYQDARAGIGAHADDEYLFDGDYQEIKVIGFSCGAERKFCMLTHGKTQLHSVTAPKLSYLTMEGWYQRDFLHAVPPQPEIEQGERINVTWRWIIHKKRPAGREKL